MFASGTLSSLAAVGPLVLALVLVLVLVVAGLVVFIVRATGKTAGLRDLAELIRALRGR